MKNGLSRHLPPMLILCGGLGTRLRSVVNDRPKPMALVAGRPFLEHLIDYYRDRSVTQFVLCAGYMGESIRAHFEGWDDVDVVIEPRPLGTGGSVALAARQLEAGAFLVCNGDSFCAVDLGALVGLVEERGALASIAVARMRNTGDYGTLGIDADDRLTSFQEKAAQAEPYCRVNAGVYCFSREVLPWLPAEGSLERDLFPRLVDTGRVLASSTDAALLDIGTPERLAGAAETLERLRTGSPEREVLQAGEQGPRL